MRYNIAITCKKKALLIPNYYKPENGVLAIIEFTVFGLDELQRCFGIKYIQKFVGTIIGYALRGTKGLKKNLRKGFFDIVSFLEGKNFINDCLMLGKFIKNELLLQNLIK